MDNYILFYKLLISSAVTVVLLISLKRIVNFVGAFDKPGPRKIHKSSVPLIGGTLIYLYIIIVCSLYSLIFEENLKFEFNIFSLNNFIFLNFIVFFIYFIGLIDDKFNLKNVKKLIFLSIFVALICYQDNSLIPRNFEFSFGWKIEINNLNKIIIFLLIISFIVSMNLFDGVNLQSGIFYLINFIFLSIYLKNINIIFILVIPVIIFLYLNYRNKCFLGDSGSNLLSFILIYLLVKSSFHSNNVIKFDEIILFIFLPCLDSLRLFIYRVWVFGQPFKADTSHFHHIVMRKTKFSFYIIISGSMILLPHIFFILGVNFFISIFIITFLYFLLLIGSNKII